MSNNPETAAPADMEAPASAPNDTDTTAEAGNAAPAKKGLSSPAAGAICLIVGIALFAVAYLALTDRAIDEASDVAQNTIAFARQSVQRNEENISSSKTKSVTAVWEKLEELENRFDFTNDADTPAIEQYLDYMNLDAVFLLDANRAIVRTAGDGQVIDAIASAIAKNESLDDLAAYPEKSCLSRETASDEYYDYAACSSPSLEGGIIVAVKHVEQGDVNDGQSMFRSMFDNYVFNMNGAVVVADEDEVLATNVSDASSYARSTFDEMLDLAIDHASGGLTKGSFDGNPCYGLSTTTNGYDLFVLFPEDQVMAQRNALLGIGVILYLAIVLAALAIHASVQNSKLRREREYMENLKRANAAKTDFLRRMSHDVRTPINGIRGLLAIGDHYADDMQKQAECRGKMWEASSFLLELVNSALDMNKLESGEMRFENKPFDLRKTVESVVDLLQVQADNAGIELTSRISVEHSNLTGSSLHVRQVLQNLGSNAIKYNHNGGTVRLECRELGAADGRASIRFVCADTGIGMSKAFQKRAFDAFAQEDSSSHAASRGTGLGLAIAKEIVEQMGGTIQLESAKDEGSVFTIDLVFDIAPQGDGANSADRLTSNASLKGMRALLAEDNDLNTEIASFVLEQEGIVVDTAKNGQEALRLFEHSPQGYYDVILMDAMMPVMNGFEAARAIRLLNRPDSQTVSIIAVTANAFSDDRERSIAAGMNGHVSKPIDAQKLIDAIRANRR